MFMVLVVSSKGGCGKSMLVMQLVLYWVQVGKCMVIVDVDCQQLSYCWVVCCLDNVFGVFGFEGGCKVLQKFFVDIECVFIDILVGVIECDFEFYFDSVDVLLVLVLLLSFDMDVMLVFVGELV